MKRENLKKAFLARFYENGLTAPDLQDSERKALWLKSKESKQEALEKAEAESPENQALAFELKKAIGAKSKSGKPKNLQPGVVTECTYAFAIARAMGLDHFELAEGSSLKLPQRLVEVVKMQGFSSRYIYFSADLSSVLLQGGGPHAVDAIFFDSTTNEYVTIEFKEPAAKVSEPDLPKYGEDGLFTSDSRFEQRHSGYLKMLRDSIAKGLNIRSLKGHNTKPSDFTRDSVEEAILAALGRADIICTHDAQGFVVMLPKDDIFSLVRVEGEIRSAGKNSYAVWTPKFLREVLAEEAGTIVGAEIHLPVNEDRWGRGRGSNENTRVRIGSLFWVPIAKAIVDGPRVKMRIADVRQKRPTIAAKIFFQDLDGNVLRDKYAVSD